MRFDSSGVLCTIRSTVGIFLGGCSWTDFLYCPSALTPCSAHTHTHRFRSEGAQFQILFLLHCYTNRLAEARGQFTICVCMHTHTCMHTCTHAHIHPGRHVRHPPRRTVDMWKSLRDVSTYVSLCSFYVSNITKLAMAGSQGKCTQFGYCRAKS